MGTSESPRSKTPLDESDNAPMRGDAVVADDGYLGCVDDVILDEAGRLACIVVRVGPLWHRHRPVIARGLIRGIAARHGIVRVRGEATVLAGLPEALPIVT
jgi:uncharacterized protein YrrD